MSRGRKDAKIILTELGEEKIKLILEAFYQAQAADVMIGFFFEGRDVKEIARKQLLFLKMLAGEHLEERVNKPAVAHVSLPPILSGHFDRRHVLLRETLEQFHVRSDLINTWIQMEESFRAAIVG